MKTMTCRQLGGPCDLKLSAETWAGMVKAVTQHVMADHPETARSMERMHRESPTRWGSEMKPKWDATTDGLL